MTTHAPRAGRDRPPGPMFHATHDQREVHPMNAQVQLLQAVHADRLARTDERRLRRALGRSLIRAAPSTPPSNTGRCTP